MENDDYNRIINYIKTLVGFASGAILLVANFIIKQNEVFECNLLKWLFICAIAISMVLFASVIIVGLTNIRNTIAHSLPKEEESECNLDLTGGLNKINVLFMAGFLFLLFSLIISLIN